MVGGVLSGAPQSRRLILEVLSAAAHPRRFLLAAGMSAKVGRTPMSDFAINNDDQLSSEHFLLEWDGVNAALCDLGSATGTLLGGVKVSAAPVSHGAWIRAGNTDFRVYEESRSLLKGVRPHTQKEMALCKELLSLRTHENEHLYAVVDTARDARSLDWLNESADTSESLFEGFDGASLWRVAPYLVELSPSTSPLFSRIVTEGWGNSLVTFIVSSSTFAEVRRHLRRHLRVLDPDQRPMYFRLYDPRVLRRFLPMASERQLGELFAEAGVFAAEGPRGSNLQVFDLYPHDGPRTEPPFQLRSRVIDIHSEEP
ncbi:MAG: DUF4123 domain-containing protein [Polyangiaceae bacterium]|nr:DUF4123 domain-containing protein [Polyangiaceae bacterium]